MLEVESERLLTAVRSLLAAKGIAVPQEIAERIAITDGGNPGQGARMVAKAWVDPAYRARMLEDGGKAAEELGIPMRGAPPLGVLEDTAELHNLVVFPVDCLSLRPYMARATTRQPPPRAPSRPSCIVGLAGKARCRFHSRRRRAVCTRWPLPPRPARNLPGTVTVDRILGL